MDVRVGVDKEDKEDMMGADKDREGGHTSYFMWSLGRVSCGSDFSYAWSSSVPFYNLDMDTL